MYTINDCTEIPSGFDSLFEQTLPAMDGGTFDWRFFDTYPSDEEKKSHIQMKYDEHLAFPHNKVIYWEKDGCAIHLAAGSITPFDPDYIRYEYALYGADNDGSKGWLHDPAYIAQTKDFFRNELGLLGYKICCHKDSGLFNYHMNKVGASENYEVTVEDEAHPDHANDITLATIKYRYL